MTAVNAGDPTWGVFSGDADLDGKRRILCGRVDRGASEYGLVGDINCDGIIDLADFRAWSMCESGPLAESAQHKECQVLDIYFDGGVDLRDFAAFQNLIVLPD